MFGSAIQNKVTRTKNSLLDLELQFFYGRAADAGDGSGDGLTRRAATADLRVTWSVPIVRDAGSHRTWLVSWLSGHEHNVQLP